jgi:uncharacterized protein
VSNATNSAAAAPKHTNLLAGEKSPYLLQHAHNPVNWHPWGAVAFARARTENKPIFLSIGYSTCHWCHVMERESFEDEKIGKYLNDHFVSIKLDREERPDVDKIYMTFVQSTTGGGGWPLNVFLTPELKPFYGGTYYPPEAKYGRPSFLQLLERLVDLWKTRHGDLVESAQDMTERLRAMATHDPENAFPAGERELHGAGQTFLTEYDPQNGGFGHAPKFPRPSQPLLLLRYAQRFGESDASKAVLHTCEAMANGGMNDQLGGGFARYSVDERWLVPHFEKMLYDQAQLVQLYLDAHLLSSEAHPAAVARDTLRYVQRDMTHPGGGFYSAEDADSEGKEGKFYCWTLAEFRTLLTAEEFPVAARYFGVTEQGNFLDHSDPHPLPGQNVLSLSQPKLSDGERTLVGSAKSKLLAERGKRVRPHLDDKILTSWNGMMLGAFARGYGVLGDEEFKVTAESNLAFLQSHVWDSATKTLYNRWRDGHRDSVQLLDAYANLLAGVTDLYEVTLDPRHLQFAVDLADGMIARFHDSKGGGFWQTVADAPDLLLRSKDDYDGAEPSGNSVAALALLRLSVICDRQDWRQVADQTIRLFAQRLHQTPHAVPHLLLALDFAQQEPKRIVLVGDFTCGSTRSLVKAAHSVFQPNKVVLGNAGPVEALAKTLPVNEEYARAFCCTGTACQPPTRDRESVRQFLVSKTP